MDYNDNDYEGHNLPLAGEDNSKISSVLRPFALPKFDFDESLHGHLRFDSLVENEVFLGITNQEDNQWIDEFSRGGNGIEFSSSVAESCALPRHINVWSEATSSESVEMLLKAVGQEEVVPGENMVGESDPVNQLGSSTRQIENNLRQDDKIDNFDLGNPSLTPTEVEGNLSRSIQSAEAEGLRNSQNTLQAQDMRFASCGHVGRDKTTENPNNGIRTASVEKGETLGLVDRSLSNQVLGHLPAVGDIGTAGSHSPSNAVSGGESVEQDKIGDISIMSSSCVAETLSFSIEEQEDCHRNEEKLNGISVETDNTERHFSHEIPSRMETSEDELGVEIHYTEFGGTSDISGKGKFESTNGGCNEVTFVDEPASGNQHGTVAFSSGTEIQRSSEDLSTLHEKSSVSSEGDGGIVCLGMNCNDVVIPMIDENTELKSVLMILPSDQQKSPVATEDAFCGSNSSLEALPATDKFKMIHEVPGCPNGDGYEDNFYPPDGPRDLKRSLISGECCEDKSMTDDLRDAGNTSLVQKDIAKGGDHNLPPLIVRSIQTCLEDTACMEVDAREGDLGVPPIENEEKTLPIDSSDMVFGDNQNAAKSTFSDAVNIDLVLNTEGQDTKLTSSCIEHCESVECHQGSSPSGDAGCRDHIIETVSTASEQRTTSVSKESLESNHVPTVGIGKDLGSVVEEKISNQHMSLVDVPRIAVPDKTCIRVGEAMAGSADDLIVQGDGAEAAPIEKPMKVEKENSDGTKSSTVLVTCCTVEMDKPNQGTDPGSGCVGHAQSDGHKQASLGSNIKCSGEVLTKSEISVVDVPAKEVGTFTFDTWPFGGQSSGATGKCMQSCPRVQTGEGSSSASGTSQSDAAIIKETSHMSSVTAAVCSPCGGVMDHKPRCGSNKSGKGSVRRGNQVKETTPLRQCEKGRKSSQYMSPLGANQFMTHESTWKPRGAVCIPTSSLPDLNTSAPTSTFFQQPFTDLQQVQLRAQIFVYGSLIQGVAPDEACMVSAFDGGRSAWEPSWHTCVERLQSQKAQGNNSETPLSSLPGSKAPDRSSRHGLHPSDVISSMTGRAGHKAIPSSINPMIPLSSPLWSIATPTSEALPLSSTTRNSVFDCQAISPLNPYRTPPMRSYITHSTGVSQAAFPVPWLASSKSSPFDISTNHPAYPTMETLKLTPAKESSLPITSGTKQSSSILTILTGASTVIAGTSLLDSKKVNLSSGRTSDAKTRKRRKSTGTEDAVQISLAASLTDTVPALAVTDMLSKKVPVVDGHDLIARSQADSMPAPVVHSHYSTPVAVSTPSISVPKSTTNQLYSMLPTSVPTDVIRSSDLNTNKSTLDIVGFSKVEEAKLQAEEAEAHAAVAIRQCEDLWCHLDQQADSGMASNIESKLASAAVAIAAAASVAKAAAAAAKIASSAAVQAKQIADEAVTKSGTRNIKEHGVGLAIASPISISKSVNWNNAPGSATSEAREAARRAENLDSILKAAELAAEAVLHAGKIVAIGDPLSLSQLAMAGSNNYWKTLEMANVSDSKPDDMNEKKSFSSKAGEVSKVYMNQNEGPGANMCMTHPVVSPIQRESSRNLVDDGGENKFQSQQDKSVSDLPKAACGVPELDIGLGSSSSSFASTSIKEGSCVEVFKDHGDLRKGWYTATVLSLKDVEALVCYTELQSDEGSELLKEWVSVEAKDSDIPKIRVPHPITAVQFEGTKKRRRAAVKDYSWLVGDKVDAWLQNCWCEGIIAEKNENDATTLSIHLPAQGETLMVKVWHLRPTLIWSDGQWTEWCRPGQDGSSQGDTPLEKRTKLESNSIETRGKELAQNLILGETARTEGSSGVVFGVPRPGKKWKFMEVSKHYVSGRSSKPNVPNDSVKLAKLLHPQGLGSRGSRHNSKLDLKEKQAAESKPRAPKSGKPPNIPRRTITKKVDPTSSQHNTHDTATSDHTTKGSMSNDEKESGEQNLTDFGSSSNAEETSGGSLAFFPQALPQESHKRTMRNAKSERANQGKLAPASEKSVKCEADEKLISEVAEPRRSNRRIQPTSRLLEGLQTSPVIPKVLSQDKGHRSQNKGNRTHG